MEFDEIGKAWIAEADDDLEGWTVLHRAEHKPGVDVVHARTMARKPYEFRIIYQKQGESNND